MLVFGWMSFNNELEMVNWLNRKNFKKENIIHIASEKNSYSLIYYK